MIRGSPVWTRRDSVQIARPRLCLVRADPKLGRPPVENASKQLYQSSHCSQSFIKKSPIELHLPTQTGIGTNIGNQ
ncbi:hypothetical protein V5799_006260 [Amblyomma americanum]|uniref:Uncharacterized protein n=1 Tax=Amblyomma americanum TaxID=6943 RepID=A0AAQ4DWW6_AMBAM